MKKGVFILTLSLLLLIGIGSIFIFNEKRDITGNVIFDNDLDNGLVSYWSFEDNTQDSFGSNNFVVANGQANYVDGKTGKGIYFDGNDALSASNSPSLNFGTGPFSYCLWVKVEGTPTGKQTVLTKRNVASIFEAGPGYDLSLESQKFFSSTAASTTTFTFYAQSNLNEWHNLCVVRNSTNWVANYVDVTKSFEILADSNLSLVSPLYLGVNPLDSSYFKGIIDEIGIWNRALSNEEVTFLFTFIPSPECEVNSDCEDSNLCTNNVCNSGRCSYPSNTLSCNDNNACTLDDVCSSGVCSGTQKNCNDGDPCTVDSCSNGVCSHGESNCGDCETNSDCDDNNVCTLDICQDDTCAITYLNITCNDQNNCTLSDRCAIGVCSGTLKDIDDDDSTTDDECLVNGTITHEKIVSNTQSSTQSSSSSSSGSSSSSASPSTDTSSTNDDPQQYGQTTSPATTKTNEKKVSVWIWIAMVILIIFIIIIGFVIFNLTKEPKPSPVPNSSFPPRPSPNFRPNPNLNIYSRPNRP